METHFLRILLLFSSAITSTDTLRLQSTPTGNIVHKNQTSLEIFHKRCTVLQWPLNWKGISHCHDQTWALSMSSCFSWSNLRNGNLKLKHVSCKVRNCNFVDSWHARKIEYAKLITLLHPYSHFACWWCWHEAEMFSISLPRVEEVSRLLMRGSWYRIGFRWLATPKKIKGKNMKSASILNNFHFSKHQMNLSRNSKTALLLSHPYSLGWKDNKKQPPLAETWIQRANSSISRVARKYRQKKNTKTSIAILRKRFKT